MHPWYRRIVTLSLTVIFGISIALWAVPWYSDMSVIWRLASDDGAVQSKAVMEASVLARTSPRFCKRLQNQLSTDDDRFFYAVVSALSNASRFRPQEDQQQLLDRLWMCNLFYTSEPQDKQFSLEKLLTNGRKNTYVQRAAKVAAADSNVDLRRIAAVIAGRVQDHETLDKLLEDEDQRVRSVAVRVVGIARVHSLTPKLVSLLESEVPSVSANAALALAMLNKGQYAKQICQRLVNTQNADLRERLLYVVTLINHDQAKPAVRAILSRAKTTSLTPMSLLAIGKLGMTDESAHVLGILQRACQPNSDVTKGQLHASLVAGDLLKLPIRKEVNSICQQYWNPRLQLVMISAAEILGRQAVQDQPGISDAPSLEDIKETLAAAAMFPQFHAATQASETPVPSAAAAVSYWLLDPKTRFFEKTDLQADPAQLIMSKPNRSAMLIQQACSAETTLAGDYVAWHLAGSSKKEAFEFGMSLLPPFDSAPLEKVYNENVRGAGAMLLALSARTNEQKRLAIQRITERLEGKGWGAEDSPILRDVYRCALLILGKHELLDKIREQRDLGASPLFSVITALCAAGDKETLQWLLLNHTIPTEDLRFFLINNRLAEVLAEIGPELPIVDVAASPDIQYWQTRILQDIFAIRRDEVSLGIRK